MKTRIAFVALALFAVLLFATAAVYPKSSDERIDPLDGLVFYKNPVTGKLALYISYELQVNHDYAIQLTDDGVTWSEAYIKSTKGAVNEVYLSYNVDPCNGLWPRVVDLGPSPH